MDIKKEFKIQYEKDFSLFAEQKKDKTKVELIFSEMGVPIDNKKLVRNCLILLYSYALYLLISLIMLPLVLIYSSSMLEAILMYIVILSALFIPTLLISQLAYFTFLFVSRNRVLYFIFNKQTVSNDLENIVANSFEDEDIRNPMMYNLMNTGYQSGTNERLKKYVFNPEEKDELFKNKIKAIDGNLKEKMEQLTNAQKSWEEKQLLDTVCSENMDGDSLLNIKRKRL